MTVRTCLLAGWLGCVGANAVAPAANAQEIVPTEPRKIQIDAAERVTASNANQQLADAVAGALSRNGQLRKFRIDVVVIGDTAELHGRVIDGSQRDIAARTARTVSGIAHVHDRLAIGDGDIKAASQEVVPNLPNAQSGQPLPGFGGRGGFPPNPGMVSPPFNSGMAMPNGGGYGPEPAPVFQGQPGMMPNPQYQPPPLPPYAWPTYAPYNNYSRVASPKAHSHSQWPFIGPMYPYPKIPLGWRRITLEWQDGSWWYGRESNSHDWWRVRYW